MPNVVLYFDKIREASRSVKSVLYGYNTLQRQNNRESDMYVFVSRKQMLKHLFPMKLSKMVVYVTCVVYKIEYERQILRCLSNT